MKSENDSHPYIISKESWPRSLARSSMDTWPSQIDIRTGLPSGRLESEVNPPVRKAFVFTAITLSTFGGLLFGYDTGVASGAMIFIRDQYKLTNFWQESIVSITIAGAWLFSMVSGYLADKIGRRRVILLASLIFILGSLVLGFANGKETLLVGRLIVGIAIGLASMIVPLYNAEISPKALRGRLVAVYQNFICFGILAAALVAGICSYDKVNGWRYMLGLAGVPALIQFIGFLFMPESPRYLVKKGSSEEALQVLKKVYVNEDDALQVVSDIINDHKKSEEESTSTMSYFAIFFHIFGSKHVRRALLIGCALHIFQQSIGINTIMYYSATIIEKSGVKDKSTSIWLSSAVAGVSFICNFGSFYFIERFGRRKTWLASLFGVLVSLIIVAIGFQLSSLNKPLIRVATGQGLDSRCGLAQSCEECVSAVDSSPSCGFCYELTPSGQVNGTCKPFPSSVTMFTSVNDKHWVNEQVCGNRSNASLMVNECPVSQVPLNSLIILIGMICYLCFFAPGVGPIPWVINSEIYPLWSRSVCTSIATSMNWLFNFLISMTFLSLISLITDYGAFYLYASIAAVAWLLFWFILPETKGISLEETESLFSNSNKKP